MTDQPVMTQALSPFGAANPNAGFLPGVAARVIGPAAKTVAVPRC